MKWGKGSISTKTLNCYHWWIVGCDGLWDSGYELYFCICFLFPGYALRCNQCVSLKIWDECKSTMKQVTCLDSQDRCVNADIRNESSRVFAKGCSNSSVCDAKNCKSIYPSAKIIKCRIDCCKGDLCNGAKVSMVSAIMLLACAIVAFGR